MIKNRDRLEIWIGERILMALPSSFAPLQDDLINIKKQTYRVVGRSFTIDDAGDYALRTIRCNAIVEKL